MAAFPAALVPSPRSTIKKDAGIRTHVTRGGGVRGRTLFAETLYQLTLVYELLNDTDHDLIITHYDGGPTTLHTVIVRAITFDVTYENEPQVSEHRGDLRTVVVVFRGTKQ